MSLEWMDHALCREVDSELFFPIQGGDSRTPISVCKICDVRLDCLRFAMEDPGLTGIWGGTTVKERQNLRRLSA